MADNQRDDTNPAEGSEPLTAADTDKIDQAAEPAVHPDAPDGTIRDGVGEALEKSEGNAW